MLNPNNFPCKPRNVNYLKPGRLYLPQKKLSAIANCQIDLTLKNHLPVGTHFHVTINFGSKPTYLTNRQGYIVWELKVPWDSHFLVLKSAGETKKFVHYLAPWKPFISQSVLICIQKFVSTIHKPACDLTVRYVFTGLVRFFKKNQPFSPYCRVLSFARG